MPQLTTKLFREHLLKVDVLDPEGVHHEFVSGLHGRKLDFDSIPTESFLLTEWMDIVSDEIKRLYPQEVLGKVAVMAVAEGTNPIVEPVAASIGELAIAIQTTKVGRNKILLTAAGYNRLQSYRPPLLIVVEDVGTTGSTSASAVEAAYQTGVQRVEVLNTWQRSANLEELAIRGISYHSIIVEPLPKFEPDECIYCDNKWDLIPYPAK